MALTAPQSLSAAANGLDVTLSWTNTNNNADYFVIERAVKFRGKTRYESVGTAAAGSTEYTDSVPSADNYWYRVTAVNASYEATSTSIRVSVSETSDQPAPQPGTLAAPSNLSASQSGNTVYLSWADNSGNELGFYLERGVKLKGKIQFERIAVVGQNITAVTDDAGVLTSGNYAYRVQAYKDGEVSAYSNTFELRLK